MSLGIISQGLAVFKLFGIILQHVAPLHVMTHFVTWLRPVLDYDTFRTILRYL